MSLLGTVGSLYMLFLIILLVISFGMIGYGLFKYLLGLGKEYMEKANLNGKNIKNGGMYMNTWLRLALFSFVGILISMVILTFLTPGAMLSGNMHNNMQMANQSGMAMNTSGMGMMGMPMNNMSSVSPGSMGLMNMMPMRGSSGGGMGMMGMPMNNMSSGGGMGMMNMPMNNMSMPMSSMPVNNMNMQNGNMMQMLKTMQMQLNQMQQQLNMINSGSMSGGGSMGGMM